MRTEVISGFFKLLEHLEKLHLFGCSDNTIVFLSIGIWIFWKHLFVFGKRSILCFVAYCSETSETKETWFSFKADWAEISFLFFFSFIDADLGIFFTDKGPLRCLIGWTLDFLKTADQSRKLRVFISFLLYLQRSIRGDTEVILDSP